MFYRFLYLSGLAVLVYELSTTDQFSQASEINWMLHSLNDHVWKHHGFRIQNFFFGTE